MPKQQQATTKEQRSSASIRPSSLRRAQIAARLTGKTMMDFVSEASDEKAIAIIKRHNVRLPADLVPAAA
jgi:uncharacterized protein (DUF1778 family)